MFEFSLNQDGWKHRNHPNMKLMWYEDMKKGLIPVIREMTKFLGYHLTELKILTLDDHLYIDNMRKTNSKGMAGGDKQTEEMMKKFFRKGTVGDWKNYFTGEKLAAWDKWIAKHLEENSSLEIPTINKA